MRLIDADELKTILSIRRTIEIIQHAVDNAPTIDAVPATIDGALGYLHKVGWIQEHDRIMTEDVAPVRHGRWEKNDDYTCSLCGYRMVIGDGAYNYCPNCGAKMDGEEKNCDTCKHYDKGWDDIVCDGCTKAHSNWERKEDDD